MGPGYPGGGGIIGWPGGGNGGKPRGEPSMGVRLGLRYPGQGRTVLRKIETCSCDDMHIVLVNLDTFPGGDCFQVIEVKVGDMALEQCRA